ncbi:hypothetical protein C7445_103239 [Alicyclobacillus sacchari]|uniref:Uncharacterized protein n=1 Tax=Alicyclobacillus sacchari TaxID=392010 RepID=A0A4R8LRG5_9BACL|nr:hypothetical protein C7445_103239 [Alicyclobacillus sacchari]
MSPSGLSNIKAKDLLTDVRKKENHKESDC